MRAAYIFGIPDHPSQNRTRLSGGSRSDGVCRRVTGRGAREGTRRLELGRRIVGRHGISRSNGVDLGVGTPVKWPATARLAAG